MSRLFGAREKILLGLSVVGDVFSEIKTGNGLVGSAYEAVYGFTPENFKKKNFYGSIHRLLKAGFIEKEIIEGEAYFKISSKGGKSIERKFPLVKLQSRRWDGYFRILIFDIPEKLKSKRQNLRLKLRELGFGMMQKSVWITFHAFEGDMRDFIENESLGYYAQIFLSKAYHLNNMNGIVDSCWNINEINERYQELVDSFGKVATKKFIQDYLEIISVDPFLPRELLPKPWAGDKAKLLFKKVTKSNS